MVALKIWRVRHENQGCERKEGETEKDCRCQTIGQEAKCAVSVGRGHQDDFNSVKRRPSLATKTHLMCRPNMTE
jgi:hypothetical protein